MSDYQQVTKSSRLKHNLLSKNTHIYVHTCGLLVLHLLCSEPLGDDVGDHNCFTVAVLGFADIRPKVDGLHVLDGQDARRRPCDVTCASLNQPPGSVRVHWALILQNKSTIYFPPDSTVKIILFLLSIF